ncbi:response regulator [Azoarcus sp. L1K30]|uniref:ATP-binding protein n=1 Tax=Azoarcus sp. L1K30 TaxID=2820277 RepID=UPI001B83E8A0|nr:ATP-binding protein [Azoarcus sp. L1K30]MBR0567712.1 response regulator [Azoarcus sp. L1K30]
MNAVDPLAEGRPDADSSADGRSAAPQRVVKIRRDYNTWVANETLEDYALRFTPRSFRKWSEFRVGNTAFGAASFLVLEAVGATMLVSYGFINSFWAILAIGLIIFLTGLPISLYAARYGVDMDLLTRGSGFGYIGSTITSLVYASFTFILFALEAAIMAYALEMALGIPPSWGYLICALVVIPLVTHGVTVISKLQTLTQPIWLFLLALPFIFLLREDPAALKGLWQYPGVDGHGGAFDLHLFAGAMTVGIALITQMGEQADYLRFMPARTAANRRRWLFGVVLGGPGWVLIGVVKLLGGALLAWMLLSRGMAPDKAVDPNQMYLLGFSAVFDSSLWAVVVTALFVIVSQLKINVTNAYAGSLAWSNFFSRLTHSHPGRVVWVVFNILIALLLMEMNVFQALGQVLGLYSNIAISWMVAVVADLVINKPLGLSPKGIEFKRSHLYDINPVGVGALLIASGLSISTFLGVYGPGLQPYAPFVALITALVSSPLIAWLTGGRYYLARAPEAVNTGGKAWVKTRQCCICGEHFEPEDTSHCPAYQGTICSLCCSLDARCDDQCKPHARLSAQWSGLLQKVLPKSMLPYLDAGLGHYLLLMAGMTGFLALLLGTLYYHELLARSTDLGSGADLGSGDLKSVLLKAFAALFLMGGIAAWWMVLTHKSRQVAQEESNRQTRLLMQEIESHRRTDEQLQNARRVAEQANHAKSRYVTSISHELRTPLNSILGYAQILDGDEAIPPQRRQAVSVIRRSGEHLLSLIEGTLDIARIEGGKFALEMRPLAFPDFVRELVGMFELQARNKGLGFRFETVGTLPEVVRADEKRLRQILINIIGNAVKFTARGSVQVRLSYRREMALFEVEDSGPGIAAEEIAHIFEPFARGSSARGGTTTGTGLGLTISKMLTDLMGGELTLDSQPGVGSVFRIRLFLPQLHDTQAAEVQPRVQRIGYKGVRRRILTVDNEHVDRELLATLLEPLGFEVGQAASGYDCLEMVPSFRPHLIFMDLAMPGIDGWETIRRLRAAGLDEAPLAVISANAFDKGLDNDAGIAAEDFILKPIRVQELLDWIGRRLQLEWVWADTPAMKEEPEAPRAVPELVLPPAPDLRALDELIELGFLRGILARLAEIERADPVYGEFVRVERELARQFQFDAMREILRRQEEGRS